MGSYFVIKQLSVQHHADLVALDAASFAKPWTAQHLLEELSCPDSLVLGYFSASRLVGALLARLVAGEGWIFRVMSHPSVRRHGFARDLLNDLWTSWREKFGTVPEFWLEVEDGNTPAIQFYRQAGFETISHRHLYYGEKDALVMKRIALDYELLDSGDGFKYERFGSYTIVRADVEAIGSPRSAISSWVTTAPDFWNVSYGNLIFKLKLSSKNIGIFPEQVENWKWLSQKVSPSSHILNLFAYTGGATMVCAQAGASVCHVDAAKSIVCAASKNAELSGLSDKPIRWIVDDAMKFLKREIVRGVQYDGVILDPPPFGHASGGSFAFRKHATELLNLCKQVLVPNPKIFLLNCYALHYTPDDAAELVKEVFTQVHVECGELTLKESQRDQKLSCSVYARFSST